MLLCANHSIFPLSQTDTQVSGHTKKEGRQTDKQTDIQINRLADMQKDTQINRHASRKTDRHADRQIYRNAGRQSPGMQAGRVLVAGNQFLVHKFVKKLTDQLLLQLNTKLFLSGKIFSSQLGIFVPTSLSLLLFSVCNTACYRIASPSPGLYPTYVIVDLSS